MLDLLLLLSKAEARRAFLDDDTGDASGSRPAGPTHRHIEVTHPPAADERLQVNQLNNVSEQKLVSHRGWMH